MPTKLKSDTARANGAKSQGPRTAEGRAKSSRNSTKHGLSSRNPVVLECEHDDDFHALHDQQMEILRPATPAEKDLVDQMVAARWRILRLQSIESDLLDTELRKEKEFEREHPSGCKIQLSDAYTAEANGSRAMALASRCESRLHRMYQSTYKLLRELQAARVKQSNVDNPEPQRADGFQPEAGKTQPAPEICDIEPRTAIISNASDPEAGGAQADSLPKFDKAGANTPEIRHPKPDIRNPFTMVRTT